MYSEVFEAESYDELQNIINHWLISHPKSRAESSLLLENTTRGVVVLVFFSGPDSENPNFQDHH